MRAKPRNRLTQTLIHRRTRAESEELRGAAGVEHAPRLAVRLGRVPYDLAAESGLARDDPREIADQHFLAATEVHRFGAVVALRGGDDSLGRVLDIEELARRRAVAPQRDRGTLRLHRLDELADHRRDDVAGLEIE